ncbi:ankyrin and HET domain-containing protein [Paraphaeosphaeria sporulosa]
MVGILSAYKYQGLVDEDEIRLLVVEPGNQDEDLRCSLVHARLSDRPEFEAISYTWGTDAPSKQILLDGHIFSVRNNIYHALKRYRHATRQRILWADAISINQDDIPERSSQVKLMKKVYMYASHVLIWLGPNLEHDDLANADVRALVERESKRNADTVTALQEFFTRSWFSRMWILQELVVAARPQIHWAMHSASWSAIAAVALAICSNYEAYGGMPIYRECTHVQHMYNIRDDFANGHAERLSYLLRVSLGLRCMDPRDKIYAIMGLIEEHEAEKIIVDYSAPVGTVYESATRMLYEQENSDPFSDLALVSFLGSVEAAPSWVPDYAFITTIQGGYTHHSQSHQTHGGSAAAVRISADDNDALLVRGYVVDTVSKILNYEDHAKEGPTGFQPWYAACAEVMEQCDYPTDEAPAEALWRTLICDTVQLPDLQGNGRAAIGYGSYYLDPRLSDYAIGRVGLSEEGEVQKEQMRYIRYATGITSSRYMQSEKGYVGWTSPHAQVGDVLCVFSGSRCPFLARRVDGKDEYRIIGDAYVHGLMSGEALALPGFEWTDLHFR